MDMTTLQQSLVNAKKVMNKVDGGNFPKNEMPMTGNQPNINMESVQQHLTRYQTYHLMVVVPVLVKNF